MHLTISVIESCMNIPDCMRAEVKAATIDNEHLVILSELRLCSWSFPKTEEQKDLQSY